MARVAAIERVKTRTTARASAEDFASRSREQQLAHRVYLFPDDATAEDAVTRLVGEETNGCLLELAGRAFGDARTGAPQVTRLGIPPVGDQYDATRLIVPVTEDGADLDVTVDLVFTRAGRGLSIGLHLGVGAPFPSALRERLTATSAQRLAAGL